MSWQIFKAEVLSQIAGPSGMTSSDDVADILASAYDNAIGRGKNLLTGASIADGVLLSGGNKETMASLWKSALRSGVNAKLSPPFDIIASFGTGVIAYWTGAQMKNFPIPPIPAPAAVANLSVIQSFVAFPGVWTPISSPVMPTDSYEAWLDSFILTAQAHLLTITGTIIVQAQYPPPAPPAPGVIPWVGYFVEPPIPGTLGGATTALSQALSDKIKNASAQLSRDEVDQEIYNRNFGAPEEQQFSTFTPLTEEQIDQLNEEEKVQYAEDKHTFNEKQTNSGVSAPIELSDDELKELLDKCIDDAKCSLGQEIIKRIAPIIPVREGLVGNTGGIIRSSERTPLSVYGYLDKLIDSHYSSYDNTTDTYRSDFPTGKNRRWLATQGTGAGVPYCAITVTYFWSKVGIDLRPPENPFIGLKHANPAYVPTWVTWANSNGLWRPNSETPQQGEAVIYDWEGDGGGDHIGMVASVTSDGTIITVEGNASVIQTTTDKKGNRISGAGIGWKVARKSKIKGYVKLPGGCESPAGEPLRNLEN